MNPALWPPTATRIGETSLGIKSPGSIVRVALRSCGIEHEGDALAPLAATCAVGIATQVVAHGDPHHSKCKKGCELNDAHKRVKAVKKRATSGEDATSQMPLDTLASAARQEDLRSSVGEKSMPRV